MVWQSGHVVDVWGVGGMLGCCQNDRERKSLVNVDLQGFTLSPGGTVFPGVVYRTFVAPAEGAEVVGRDLQNRDIE